MKFFRKSILVKILVVFFVILLFSLAGVTTYDSIDTKKRLFKTAVETEQLLSNQIERSAEVLFSTMEMTLQGISRESSVTNILVADKYKDEIYKDFKRYKDGNRFIKELIMATKDNQLFQSSKSLSVEKKVNAQELSWFKKAVENRGRVIYTSPYVNEKTGDREIIIAKTVNKDGNVIGVVAGVISADLIQELLHEIRLGKTGYAFSIDSLGIITSHHNEEKIALDVSSEEFFNNMINKNDGLIEYKIGGRKKFLYFKNNPRTGWKFAVTMDYKEISEEMRGNIVKNLIILIVTLIIGTFLSKGIVESVVRPIRRLESAMEEIEKNGNLSIVLEIEHEDEVGLLTKSFNKMIWEIRTLVESVSGASTKLVNFSSQFTSICQSNAASAQQAAASLEEIAEGSVDQHRQTDSILKETMEFADYINGIAVNAKKVSKGANESQGLNINGVSKIKELHGISGENIEYVDKVTEEIKGLHEKSQAIVKITESIEKIAKQTNMISLNARIEAAKAGEVGASFSVVAHEVQRLADETQDLASSIHHYIEDMVKQVEITTRMMENTKDISYKQFDVMLKAEEIFKNIENSSNMIVDEVEYLNQSIDQMSLKKENILEGINKIATVTEQSAELVKEVSAGVENQSQNIEQVSHNSEELMNMAKDLEDRICVFSTEGDTELPTKAIDIKSEGNKIESIYKLRNLLKASRFKSIRIEKLNLKIIDLKRFKKKFKSSGLLKKIKLKRLLNR